MKAGWKITFTISSLGAGGAERVLSHMANHWARAGHNISIITLSSQEPFYPLESSVKCVSLGLASQSQHFIEVFFRNFERIWKLRETLRLLQPDVVISFINTTNVLTLLAARGASIPVSVSDRSNPWKDKVGKAWERLIDLTYPWADAIILQTKEFETAYPLKARQKIRIIPNGIFPLEKRGNAAEALARPSIISVGQIGAEKGMDILITAFALLKESLPNWHLVIAGDGPDRLALQALSERLGVAERVQFIGLVENSVWYFEQSDIFVLASRFEGFPNALYKAMRCGLPAIASESSPAIREIIRDNEDGMIIPLESPGKLAEALMELAGDAEKRRRMGEKAREITTRFGFETVMQKWEHVIRSVLRR
jgi:glycosyltransferase involved in cell wall biosynthesis